MIRLGIDIGGSAIKAALVDIKAGTFASEKVRFRFTNESEPERALEGIKKMIKRLDFDGPIGVGFPGRLRGTSVENAPNLHPEWRGKDLVTFFGTGTGCKVSILNDADAAALAELRIGNPIIKQTHRTLFLTLGTGIGSALILDGKIWKDTELGHLLFHGQAAEHYGSAAVKRIEKLSWKQWALRLNEVLERYDFLFSPDLFVLGGAISSNLEKFQKYLCFPEEKVIRATLGNDAGIIGAAMATE